MSGNGCATGFCFEGVKAASAARRGCGCGGDPSHACTCPTSPSGAPSRVASKALGMLGLKVVPKARKTATETAMVLSRPAAPGPTPPKVAAPSAGVFVEVGPRFMPSGVINPDAANRDEVPEALTREYSADQWFRMGASERAAAITAQRRRAGEEESAARREVIAGVGAGITTVGRTITDIINGGARAELDTLRENNRATEAERAAGLRRFEAENLLAIETLRAQAASATGAAQGPLLAQLAEAQRLGDQARAALASPRTPPPAAGLSTGTMVAIGAGALAVVGLGVVLATRGGPRSNPSSGRRHAKRRAARRSRR